MDGRQPSHHIRPGSNASKIIEKVDIVQEISKYVELKPSSKELTGLCPFHNEDTPSFYVNPGKQLYFCFGCQQGGNVISFKSKIAHLPYSDAITALAKDYHIPLSTHTVDKLSPLYEFMGHVATYYQSSLKSATLAKEYLSTRKIEDKSIQAFRLGYAPSEWENLKKGLPRFNRQLGIDAGVLIEHNARAYDRFRHRIIFPIHNHLGTVVGFGGRAIGDDKPKYLNSPETLAFKKGHILYGLHHAIQSGTKQLIIVEGYLDVITLHQAGIKGAVAPLGTAFTHGHFQLASRYAQEIIFCFDGDDPGRQAAKKAFYNIINHVGDGVACSFLFLPDGTDPDSLLHTHGVDHFSALIEAAIPLSQYLLQHLSPIGHNDSLEHQAQRMKFIADVIDKMPNSMLKQLISKEVHFPHKEDEKVASMPKAQVMNGPGNTVERLLFLLFSYPTLVEKNQLVLEKYQIYLPKVCQEALSYLRENPSASLALFLEASDASLNDPLFMLYKPATVHLDTQEMGDIIHSFQLLILNEKIDQKMRELQDKQPSPEDYESLQTMLQIKHLLKKNKIKLVTE